MDIKLVIPPEIKRDINIYSGFIDPGSDFYKKSVRGLFLSDENIKYLSNEVYQLITHRQFVEDNLEPRSVDYMDDQSDFLMDQSRTNDSQTGFNNRSPYFDKTGMMIYEFSKIKNRIGNIIKDSIYEYKLPYPEEISINNPIQELHSINLDFTVKLARNFIQSPGNIIDKFNAVNPDTGDNEYDIEYEYNAESYADGDWHPEHLFTNSLHNKNNPYWTENNITFTSHPDATGPGHRYNYEFYNKFPYRELNRVSNNLYPCRKGVHRYKNQSEYGEFPKWQYTVNKRWYDRDNSEGLREGGLSSRRTQTPHGYDMTALTLKSTY